jgi:hypothetical protein
MHRYGVSRKSRFSRFQIVSIKRIASRTSMSCRISSPVCCLIQTFRMTVYKDDNKRNETKRNETRNHTLKRNVASPNIVCIDSNTNHNGAFFEFITLHFDATTLPSLTCGSNIASSGFDFDERSRRCNCTNSSYRFGQKARFQPRIFTR